MASVTSLQDVNEDNVHNLLAAVHASVMYGNKNTEVIISKSVRICFNLSYPNL